MLDIMSFKRKDSIMVDTLRSIIIAEPDWNVSGRVHIAKRMMKQAESLQLLPREHLGGRKGKKSIEGAITKRLLMDNAKLTTTPIAIISTDAANCYDRIVHKYVALVCKKWGVPHNVIHSLLQPLNKAKHYTRTAFGDSPQFFTGSNLQGTGQGNTGSALF